MSYFAGGGHRSGPGEHPEWQSAMRGLHVLRDLTDGGWGAPSSLPAAVVALRNLRRQWTEEELSSKEDFLGPDPHLAVRCARHYERAAAIIVSAAVNTASLFVEPPPASWFHESSPGAPPSEPSEVQEALPVGTIVTSQAAARIDLAGGWTDTPPISYETGGSVLNAAVTVSGERPVEVQCERIQIPRVELVCIGQDGLASSTVVCTSINDFR